MQTELRLQTAGSGYATGPVTKAPAWHGLVAWDMLFNGLTTGLFLAAAISLLPAGWITLEWVRRLAVVIGLLPALGSAVYKGVLLSTNAQPGWKDARWLGGYLTSSAVMLGCAEMLVLSVLMGHASAAAMLRPALGLLLVVNLIPLCLLLADLRTTLSRTYTHRELYGVGAVSLGGGMLIPLCLLFVVGNSFFMLSAVTFILLGSLVIRFVIVKLPHASA
jgi:hypothetical protein